jgi:menaquinone-specific isochorismate synthase
MQFERTNCVWVATTEQGIMETMTVRRPDTAELHRLIDESIRKAQSTGSEILVSYTQNWDAVDPIDVFTAAESFTSDRWYWENPEEERTIVSIGILAGLTPPRNVRFSEVSRALAQYAARAAVKSDTPSESQSPTLFVAFSFDPHVQQDRLVWQGFPSTYLLTPRLTVTHEKDSVRLTLNATVTPRADTDSLMAAVDEFITQLMEALENQAESKFIVDELEPDRTNETEIRQYIRAVSRVETEIRAGELTSVSIARRKKISTNGLYRLNRTLRYLRGRFPTSRIVAAGRHGSTFIGYAPHPSITRQGNFVRLRTSTGEIRRGDNPELDSALAEQLLNDPDDIDRHDRALDHLADVLDEHADEYEISDEPSILSTRERHLLHTSVDVEVSSEQGLFELVQALHPTPETSGSPIPDAVKFIRDEEQLDRGWFASPFGWVDLNGNGEFVNATQCAVVRAPVLEQQRAYIFTSTPVRSGSDPEDLLVQSERDLEPLKTALKQ